MKYIPLLAIFAAFALATAAADAPPKEKPELEVLHGPAMAMLGKVARIEVPQGYVFIDGKTLRNLMEAAGEPVAEGMLGAMQPTNSDWSVTFSFLDIGYVKDDDKDKLNADKLLQEYRDGTEAGNKIRAKAGIPPIHVVGWEQPPRYNPETHNLEWAIRGNCEGEDILNYDTRVLGRKGVMQIKLIVEPREFAATLPAFTNLLADYKFQDGEHYAEYRPGDKVAKYGLAALVVGGAAVGAAKLGLFASLAVFFKKAWKLVVVALVAVAGMFKKLFARLFGSRDTYRGGE